MAKLNSSGTATSVYILTAGNQQMAELDSGTSAHTNIYAPGGRLLATYDSSSQPSPGYHYNLTDWLGTKRMQTTSGGNQQETCLSNPFGDGLSCSGGVDATEQHFTGKDRDVESGLDYFYARYYSSMLGRFLTPDWAGKPTAVPYASFGDPQSLNLYAYVRNNPNSGIDADGHCGVGNTAANAECAAGEEQSATGGESPAFLGGSEDPSQFDEWDASIGDLVARVESPPTPPGDDGSAQQKISARDKAYLNNYYAAVAAMAKQYGVDPALVLGLGVESGFGTSPRYKRTGDAFGMSGGKAKDIMNFGSPEANVSKLFELFGDRMRGTGSNINSFLNGLELEDAKGNQLTTPPDRNGNVQNLCCMYNSVSVPPTAWKALITGGIKEMQRDIPAFLSQ